MRNVFCGRLPSGTGLGMIRNISDDSFFPMWCPKCLLSSLCDVRNVFCLPCVVSEMYSVFPMQCPECLLTSLCGVRNVFCLPHVLSGMSLSSFCGLRNVFCLPYVVSGTSSDFCGV